jgi:hypothetical protein
MGVVGGGDGGGMGGGSAGDKRGREEVGAVDVALQQQKRLQATPLQSTQHQPHLQPTPPSVDNMDAHIDFLYRSAAMGRLKPAAQAI